MNENLTPIPYGRQSISEDDINAVVEVLKSDFLTQGPKIEEFEEQFAEYTGSKYSVAVANGTAALHLSALSKDNIAGLKIITTPITFAATANCIKYAGGEVVFADIESSSYLMDLNYIEDLIKKSPSQYAGIICVDFAGRPFNMEELNSLARKYGLWVIEDAAHALGGYYYDSKKYKHFCGNNAYSDMAIFSFHPVKHITSGEGGMITTNDLNLYKKLQRLRTHGITKDINNYKNSSDPNSNQLWYYELQDLGFNYRLSDIHAGLGISQLKNAESNLEKRRIIAKNYDNYFNSNSKLKEFVKISPLKNEGHAYHLYIIEAENRNGLYNYLRKAGIYCQVHYIPLHLMPYYRAGSTAKTYLPFAENYYEKCLSLPMYHALTPQQQMYVQDKIYEFYSQNYES